MSPLLFPLLLSPMRVQKVNFPRSLRASFTRTAKKAFPNETYAICLGTKSTDSVDISLLFYPSFELGKDGLSVSMDASVYVLAEQFGRECNLVLCADLHSHPWGKENPIFEPIPSERDWDADRPHRQMVTHGICVVTETPKGLRARYRFWPFIKPIELAS